MQAILGQLERSYVGKHLPMERDSSSCDGRVGDQDLMGKFVVGMWGSSVGWSGGVDGFKE